MLFAARKLRLHPALKNPTVLVVVDRIDLDSQISGTFYAADMANLVRTDSRKELSELLEQGCAEGRDHHDPQVRRSRRRAERPRQHHRDGRRGAPHAGRRSRPQDARGAAERVPVRPDRHADQPRRPEHLLRLRRGDRRERLHEPLRAGRLDPRRSDEGAAFRAAAGRPAHRPEGHRGGLCRTDRGPNRRGPGQARRAAAKMSILVKAPERISAICADIAKHYPGKGRAERLRRAGSYLRPRELPALQTGARPPPAARSLGHRHLGQQRRARSMRRIDATGMRRKSCSTGSAIPRTR